MARPGTFAPGTSGNPRGRPRKGSTLTDFLRWSASQIVSAEDRRTKAQAAAEAAWQAAIGGDVPALKLVFDRYDGPLPQKLEHTGAEGGAILLHWAEADHDDN